MLTKLKSMLSLALKDDAGKSLAGLGSEDHSAPIRSSLSKGACGKQQHLTAKDFISMAKAQVQTRRHDQA